MKRWHTNKTKPRACNCEQIIVIWKDGEVSLGYPDIGRYGKMFVTYDGAVDFDWEESKDDIKYWAYVDKYFEKELKGELI